MVCSTFLLMFFAPTYIVLYYIQYIFYIYILAVSGYNQYLLDSNLSQCNNAYRNMSCHLSHWKLSFVTALSLTAMNLKRYM